MKGKIWKCSHVTENRNPGWFFSLSLWESLCFAVTPVLSQGPHSGICDVGPQLERCVFLSKDNSRCCAVQWRRKSCSSHQLCYKITFFSLDHLHSVKSSLNLVGALVSRLTPEFGGLTQLLMRKLDFFFLSAAGWAVWKGCRRMLGILFTRWH